MGEGCVLVACLGAQDRGTSDVSSLCDVVRLEVGRVEAARETAHDLDVRVTLCRVENLLTLDNGDAQCLSLS